MPGRGSVAIALLVAGFAWAGCDGDVGSDVIATQGAGATDDGGGEGDGDADTLPDAASEEASDADARDGARAAVVSNPVAVLSAQGPSCIACAEANCAIVVNGCANIAGNADAGPAAGAARSELCVDTLTCALLTGCAVPMPSVCYCGTKSQSVCLGASWQANGVCRSSLERSLESTDQLTVLSSFSDPTLGGAWAMLLLQCLADNACTSCFGITTDAGEAGAEASTSGDR